MNSPRENEIIRELHGRAQAAELERDTAARELEQLRRDNQILCGRIEDLRAAREVGLQALQDLLEGAARELVHPSDSMLTAMQEAQQVLREAKQRGGGR